MVRPTVLARYKQNRLQQLRGFCYAVRSGSISRAAEKMLLSQSSVSLQIKALEREFKTQLFERHGPRISLTADGQTLYDLAWPLVEGIDRLEGQFAASRESLERGQVRIAAGGSTIQYLLPSFIEAFVHEAPGVDVRLHNVTGQAGVALLREGEVDFAVGPMPEAAADLLFFPHVTYDPVLITRCDHPLAARKRIGLKDIARYSLILPPKSHSTWRFVEAVFTEHSLDYDVKLEVGGYEVIKRYVELGLGISIVMSHCLTESDHLYRESVSRYFPRRTYGVLLRKGHVLTPAAIHFVQMLCPDFDSTSKPPTPSRKRGSRRAKRKSK